MGVVRSEGDWRLEKVSNGVYEITYDRDPQIKVITSDYTPDPLNDERQDLMIDVREVDSFSDAENLFNEVASRGPPNTGFNVGGDSAAIVGSSATEQAGELEDVPNIALIPVFLFVGGYVMYNAGFALTAPTFLFGLLLVGVSVVATGWAGLLYKTKGTDSVMEFLFATSSDSGSSKRSKSGREDVEKTPPAPEKLRHELFFDRANQQCEWCEEPLDAPEVHHIQPRSEGGPNDPENLIVLCPNCHNKADSGLISRSQLTAKLERIN